MSEPYENTMSIEQLREEVRRLWDAQDQLDHALRELPVVPHWTVLKMLEAHPRSVDFQTLWSIGKQVQGEMNNLQKYELHKQPVPYKTEYEIAAGTWSVLREALLKLKNKTKPEPVK